MNIFLGLVFIVAGSVITIKSEWLLQNLGRMSWAEEHLGVYGGSRMMYKLIGLIIILLGFLTATDMMGSVAEATLGRLFGL